MKKLAISTISKSEAYLEPLITRFKSHPEFAPIIFHPLPKGEEHNITEFNLIYKRAEIFFNNNPGIDAVIIPSDRIEHLPVAIAAFHNNIPIIQLYGGDISGNATFDDYNRYVYSIYASIVFCSTEEAAWRVRLLFALLAKATKNIYVSGMTHFDDIVPDESEVPAEPYNLVIYDSITMAKSPGEKMRSELKEIERVLSANNETTIWLEPNEDPGRDIIIDFARKLKHVNFMHRIPHNKFLGLLKHCSRLISNSSMIFYEAKRFLKDDQIIRIGERNKLREEVPFSTGGSDKIVKILEGIDFDKI